MGDSTTVSNDHWQAVLRWKQGHHVFHVLLVSMNTVLDDSMNALVQRDWSRLVSSLNRLTALYDASTSTMKYAADFSKDRYENLIRPSMMPPYLSPGFTGELNTEHKVMVDGVLNLRHCLQAELGTRKQWPADVVEAWTRLSKSQSQNRKHHALVCQKFVDDGASLLQEFYADKQNAEQNTGEES